MTDFLAVLGYERWILDALLLLPLVGVLPIALAPAARARHIALAVVLLELVLSLGLWWAFDPSTPVMQFAVEGAWLPRWGIRYAVGLDGLSLFMVLLTTAIMPLDINAARPANRPIIIITPPMRSMPPPIAIVAESSPPPDADGGNPSSFCVPCHMNKNPVTILMIAYT